MVSSQYDEIVRAMDVVPVPAENYAGLCAAKRDMDRFLLKAEEDGYSQVLCSYARIGLGFDSSEKNWGDAGKGSRRGDADAGYDAGQQCRLRSALQVVPGERAFPEAPAYGIDVVYASRCKAI